MSTQNKKTQSKTVETLKPVEAAANATKEQYETVVKAGSKAAQKNYEQAVAMTKEQVEKASTAMFKGYDEFSTLNKETMDAVMKSSNIYAKGMERLSKEMMAFTQSTVEANMATAKAFANAKTLREIFDLQAELARANFDKAMAESAKLTEMSVKVANEAMEPLQSRFNVTVEKMMKPIAA
ncbi:MAG: phasin family protein [Xanthomonadales bacterium]|nr:phasin family protein [Xanthomonadales bacterium]